MARLLIKARTLLALGIVNILRVAWFRLGVRFGWNPVRRLRVEPPEGPFFTRPGPPPPELTGAGCLVAFRTVFRTLPGAGW